MGPGMDNDAFRGKKEPKGHSGGAIHSAEKAHKKSSKAHGTGETIMRTAGHQGPQATSLPGGINIIHDVQKAGRGATGVPGIISSTTLGPEVRRRLVSGIIESPMAAESADGPVHRVQGVDATAYNEGQVHIAGSRFK